MLRFSWLFTILSMEMTRVFMDGHLRNASFTVAESIFSSRFATFMSREIYALRCTEKRHCKCAQVNANAVRFGEWVADKTGPSTVRRATAPHYPREGGLRQLNERTN